MDVILKQTGTLFVMLMLGYLASRMGWMSRETRSGLSGILLYIVTPCVILHSFQTPAELEMWRDMCITAGVIAAFLAGGLCLCLWLFGRQSAVRRATAAFGAAFGNVGFMGVPVVASFVGEEALIYVSTGMAAFNLITWTVGVRAFDRHAFRLKTLVASPVLYAVAIGMAMFFLQARLPEFIGGVVDMVSATASPLSMMMVGAILAECPIRALVKDRVVLEAAAMRLLVFPALTLALCCICGIEGRLRMVLVLLNGMPGAVNTVLLSLRFHGDEELASRIVALSTLLYLPAVVVWMMILH